MLSNKIINAYENILIEELQVAMGCTEPIAIAYAASILSDALGKLPKEITVNLSGNIIKNVKSVIVPSTGGMHGIESAIAAGIISNRYDLKLELLSILTGSDVEKISEFEKGLFEYLTATRDGLLAEIRESGALTDETKSQIVKSVS